jgi:UDPglucose 6-dehydrogenase
MEIAVIGAGYVGLVTGSCLAELGHRVTCVDCDGPRIEGLQRGRLPIYEPGLEPLLARNLAAGRIDFSTDLARSIRPAEVVFICVGTPPGPHGQADLSQVESAARGIGAALEGGYKIIVNKSTVPVGCGDWVSMLIRDGVYARRLERLPVPIGAVPAPSAAGDDNWPLDRMPPDGFDFRVPAFDVVSNPEFLREGSAVEDMLFPDRIVVGANSREAVRVMEALYEPILQQSFPWPELPRHRQLVRLLVTDLTSAEMIKYAANGFLATKVSFINEMATLCERVGADINDVSQGIGLDRRIGQRFLRAGIGWGGSCFQKDVAALAHIAGDYGAPVPILEAVQEVNRRRLLLVVQKLQDRLKVLKSKTIGLLGLAFKPNTDDLRDAPALTIAERLLILGARVRASDPVAGDKARHLLPGVDIVPDAGMLAEGCDGLVLVTEWDEFRLLDYQFLRDCMRTPIFVDGRNFLNRDGMRQLGFDYIAIGR